MDTFDKFQRNGVILLYFLVILKCSFAQLGIINKQNPEWNRIINSFFEIDPKGNYRFGFVDTDGIRREETGGFDHNQIYVITGHYSYYDEDGQFYIVQYTVDKDGYHVFPPLPMKQDDLPALSYSSFASPRIVAALLG